MAEYAQAAAGTFQEEKGATVSTVGSPYVYDGNDADDKVQGVYQSSCASHAATLLFLARVCRPDL